jgi:hypothetical protein
MWWSTDTNSDANSNTDANSDADSNTDADTDAGSERAEQPDGDAGFNKSNKLVVDR